MQAKTLGVIGGLGPQATADFVLKVIKQTPAEKDQDHIPMIVHNNSQVPDRIASIQGTGPDAGVVLEQMAVDLAGWGADYLVMPCHTAHYYYPQIKAAIQIPFLNMIEETATYLAKNNIRRIGILATRATIETNLYTHACQAQGIELVTPTPALQVCVLEIIAQVKKNAYRHLLSEQYAQPLFDYFHQAQVHHLLLACTELPIFFNKDHFPKEQFIDATDLLAKKVIAERF